MNPGDAGFHVIAMAGERFPKSERILKREVFRRVYERGRKVQGKYFTAFIQPNSLESSRIGITVTRKAGKSVRRNRSRRLIREVFRRNRRLAPEGFDIVINVKGNLADATYDDIERDFVRFLERSK